MVQKRYLNSLLESFNNEVNNKFEDILQGGLSDNLTLDDIANMHDMDITDIQHEFAIGVDIEKEHTNDEKLSKEIAKDHLVEDPEYYTKLKSIENNNKNDFEVLLESLCDFICLEFNNLEKPICNLINFDSSNISNPLGSTAYYDPNNKTINLYTYGRSIKDILRSYAHEYIHYIQDLEDRLNNINTTNINEDDYLKTIEEEAYLKGNILFRSWENNLKKKQCIYNK